MTRLAGFLLIVEEHFEKVILGQFSLKILLIKRNTFRKQSKYMLKSNFLISKIIFDFLKAIPDMSLYQCIIQL